MTGEDEPRLSFGGIVDGGVDGHLAAYLEQHPDEHVPLTLERPGDVDDREHNDAWQDDAPPVTRDEVLARVKAWAQKLDVPLAPWQAALAARAMERPRDLWQLEGGRPAAHLYGLPVVESKLVPEGQMYLVGRDAFESIGHVEGIAPAVDAADVAREAWLWGRSIRMTATVMHGRTVQVQLAEGGARQLAKLFGIPRSLLEPHAKTAQQMRAEYRRKTRRRNRRRSR